VTNAERVNQPRQIVGLAALDLLDHADPSQHVALLNLSVSQFKNGNADDVAALERWLNSKGEYERVIDAIPVEQALKERDAFLQYLDALGALKRWVDIKQLLESERFPLDAFMARMYVARCNAQLGENTAAGNNWQRAIEATAGDVSKLMQVAEFAEKNGVLDVADSAYANAITAAPNLRAAYQGRLRIAQASQARAEHMLWKAWLPALLVLAAAFLAFSAPRTNRTSTGNEGTQQHHGEAPQRDQIAVS